MNIMIISTPRRVDIYFVPSDVDDLKVVEDVHVHSEISSFVEDPLANLDTLFIDESHVSSAGTSDVVDVLVNFSTPIPDEIYIHEKNQEGQATEVEFIPIVFSFSQSLEFLVIVHQVSSSIFLLVDV